MNYFVTKVQDIQSKGFQRAIITDHQTVMVDDYKLIPLENKWMIRTIGNSEDPDSMDWVYCSNDNVVVEQYNKSIRDLLLKHYTIGSREARNIREACKETNKHIFL